LAAQWRTLEQAIYASLIDHSIGTALAGGYRELTVLFAHWCGLAEAAIAPLLEPPANTVNRRLAALLERLAEALERNPPLLRQLVATADARLLAEDPMTHHVWAMLIGDFGHLAPSAAELAVPRDREHPQRLIRAAVQLANSPKQRPPVASLAAPPLAGWRGVILGHLARRARRFHPYRDRLKLCALRLFEPLRALALAAGAMLVERNILDEPAAVFFLERDELIGWLEHERKPGDWRARRLLHQTHGAEPPVARFASDAGGRLIALPEPDSSERLLGVAAAPGCVMGIARILHNPDQGERLAPGEILVAPSADPAWCALFLVAGGAVLATGGRLSHSALMARELGVPCIVGVAGAMTRIRDGERITLLADQGEVLLGEHLPASPLD
jgi:pyruvate,water dikinase